MADTADKPVWEVDGDALRQEFQHVLQNHGVEASYDLGDALVNQVTGNGWIKPAWPDALLAAANARIATLTVERKEDAARQGAEIMRQLALIQQQGSEIVRWQGRAETASASLAEARAALRASAVDLVWLEGRVREVIDEALHDDDPVAYGAAAIMSLHASHVILDATDAVIAALSPPQQAGTEAQS